MQIHIPDPAYTGSEQARANFRLAAKIAIGLVALIWLIQLINWGLDLGLQKLRGHGDVSTTMITRTSLN